jgi:hypothetical protein
MKMSSLPKWAQGWKDEPPANGRLCLRKFITHDGRARYVYKALPHGHDVVGHGVEVSTPIASHQEPEGVLRVCSVHGGVTVLPGSTNVVYVKVVKR